uniref:Semaphorin-3aa n=1 Tax=Sinocyclocheilus rhinocerous TaxID=307959 RepID=A0A673JPP1_9TELE
LSPSPTTTQMSRILAGRNADGYYRSGLIWALERSCSLCYDTFLMDEERGRLLVGAEDHVFSFDLVNINRDVKQIAWPATPSKRDECKWAGKDLGKECSNFVRVLQPYNQTHIYICGTGAFHPICSYLEIGKRAEDNIFRLDANYFENGRGKSPYDPNMQSSSLLIDGELYSGTSADFMGRDFAIFRTLGSHHPVRTEQHDSRWLNDPRFLGIHLIPESDNPEDDKIFLFFKESAMDGEHTGKATISRIGQLCKNDMGGHRSLVNKWTTFLKAKLTCSVPGLSGIDTHFDELQDVFLMSAKDPKNPVIYAVFTTSSNIFRGSAICMYSMADIRRVFLGPYAHRDGPNYQWVPFQGRVPYPRPAKLSEALIPPKTFLMMLSHLHACTQPCITPCNRWVGSPSWCARTWSTSSLSWWWIVWKLKMASTMSCSSAQVSKTNQHVSTEI